MKGEKIILKLFFLFFLYREKKCLSINVFVISMADQQSDLNGLKWKCSAWCCAAKPVKKSLRNDPFKAKILPTWSKQGQAAPTHTPRWIIIRYTKYYELATVGSLKKFRSKPESQLLLPTVTAMKKHSPIFCPQLSLNKVQLFQALINFSGKHIVTLCKLC